MSPKTAVIDVDPVVDPVLAPVPESFQKIEHIVVLMLENRSFDHLIGWLKSSDPRIEGLTGNEVNFQNPKAPLQGAQKVWNAADYKMPFDPDHEFTDVQIQLYGASPASVDVPNPPAEPAPMNGFLSRGIHAANAAKTPASFPMVMEYFSPDQVPVVSTLARQFAVCNFWHSSLPGPTWPNRFFVHAATSGGLANSPSDTQIALGFSFNNGTIYQRLSDADKNWRIYHDSLPQSIGIGSLRLHYIDPFTKHYRGMNFFDGDIHSKSFPEYTFIEPNYDTGSNYLDGNSMHPLNDVRKGEELVKQVYESIRNSPYWNSTMLAIIFDEHGGFYDHVPPPAAAPTGDDKSYAGTSFAFDRLGVRVPAIIISAYTQQGTVIGRDVGGSPIVFDHSSVLATAEKRFGLKPLTKRDAAARTLELAVNLKAPRADAPTALPEPPKDSFAQSVKSFLAKVPAAASGSAPLSENQKSFLALSMALDLETSDPSKHAAIRRRHKAIKTQKGAAKYIREIEQRIQTARKMPSEL